MFVTMFEVILDYSSHFEIGEIFGRNEGNACSDKELQTKSDTCIKSSNDLFCLQSLHTRFNPLTLLH